MRSSVNNDNDGENNHGVSVVVDDESVTDPPDLQAANLYFETEIGDDDDEKATTTPTTTTQQQPLHSRYRQFISFLITPVFLRYFSVIVCSSLIIKSVVCFLTCSFNIPTYILSFYSLIFALISVAAEFDIAMIFVPFGFLRPRFSRAFWYLFLGTLAIESRWWTWLIFCFFIALAILNFTAAVFGSEDTKNALELQMTIKNLKQANENIQSIQAKQQQLTTREIEKAEENENKNENKHEHDDADEEETEIDIELQLPESNEMNHNHLIT